MPEEQKPSPPMGERSKPQTFSNTALATFFSNVLQNMPTSIPNFWDRHPGKSFWDIAEEMMADPHIQSVFRSRRAGVAGRAWEIIPADDSPKAGKIADFVRKTLNSIPNFEHSLAHLLKAVPYGHSVAEVMWRIDAAATRIDALKTRRPERFTLGDDNVLRLIDSETYRLQDLPERKFICHKHDPQDDTPYAMGILVSLYWPWYFKKHAESFWMIVAEKFGVPSVIGKYPSHYTDGDVKALITALLNLQQDSVAAVPVDTEVNLNLAQASVGERGNFFRELLDFMNAEISKTVLGGTLTQEVGDVGSYAAAQTHQEVRQEIIEADARLLQSTLDATLITWLVEFNYGPDVARELTPWIVINVQPSRATPEFANTLKTLQDMGYPVPKRFVAETFGLPQGEEDNEILEPRSGGAIPFHERSPFE